MYYGNLLIVFVVYNDNIWCWTAVHKIIFFTTIHTARCICMHTLYMSVIWWYIYCSDWLYWLYWLKKVLAWVQSMVRFSVFLFVFILVIMLYYTWINGHHVFLCSKFFLFFSTHTSAKFYTIGCNQLYTTNVTKGHSRHSTFWCSMKYIWCCHNRIPKNKLSSLLLSLIFCLLQIMT